MPTKAFRCKGCGASSNDHWPVYAPDGWSRTRTIETGPYKIATIRVCAKTGCKGIYDMEDRRPDA